MSFTLLEWWFVKICNNYSTRLLKLQNRSKNYGFLLLGLQKNLAHSR